MALPKENVEITEPHHLPGQIFGGTHQMEPWFKIPQAGVLLYQTDSLRLLNQMEPVFDCIFADPPYFLSNDGITCQAGRMVSVNKGMWDKAATFEEIHQFNLKWLGACLQVLKPNGTIWVSGTQHNIHSVGFAMQTLGYKILNDIAWYKVNPPPNLACRYFTHSTETILWARKSPKSRHYFNYPLMKRMNGGKQMQNLWHIKPPGPAEKRYGKHPTQKPEALLDRIILASTQEGDLVLDPFCGSGTTGVSCIRHGRQFVGVDLEREFLDLAESRISHIYLERQLQNCRVSAHELTHAAFNGYTWADLICAAITGLGGKAHLREINRLVRTWAYESSNRTWPSTIRRVVRQSSMFEPLGHGNYRVTSHQPITV